MRKKLLLAVFLTMPGFAGAQDCSLESVQEKVKRAALALEKLDGGGAALTEEIYSYSSRKDTWAVIYSYSGVQKLWTVMTDESGCRVLSVVLESPR